jgi:hypothetical protein
LTVRKRAISHQEAPTLTTCFHPWKLLATWIDAIVGARSTDNSLLDHRLHHMRERRAAIRSDVKDGNCLTRQCLLPPTPYRLGDDQPEGDATSVAGQASVDRVVGASR